MTQQLEVTTAREQGLETRANPPPMMSEPRFSSMDELHVRHGHPPEANERLMLILGALVMGAFVFSILYLLILFLE